MKIGIVYELKTSRLKAMDYQTARSLTLLIRTIANAGCSSTEQGRGIG